MKSIYLVATLLLLISINSSAQKIHKNDIEGFTFCVDDDKIIQNDGEACKDKILYKLCQWRNQATRIEDYCSWWPFAKPYKDYRFYFFQDDTRWGSFNRLTVWKLDDNDSLNYICSKIMPENSILKKVSVFKDGSLVLLTEAIHGDADFVNGRYSFLCGSPCSLQVFYEGSWSKEYGLGVDTNKYYDIDCPVDKITEVTEYGNFDEQGFRIDSANVKVIDLYEIAKEFLETDTLK